VKYWEFRLLTLPVTATTIGQFSLPDPTWFPAAGVAVPAVGAPIYEVRVHREPEQVSD
jgi:hypothetical protein